MSREILINVGIGETRVAIVEAGRLEQYFVERTLSADGGLQSGSDQPRIGDVILGRVLRVLPGMQAAFIEIGAERAGFLAAREARCLAMPRAENDAQTPPIGQCVREGEKILVQVIKDPAGEKGARLSANVTLCGRLLVLTPNQPGISLSRRIEDEAERARLSTICETAISKVLPGSGCIARTVSIDAQPDDLHNDAAQLAALWKEIGDARNHSKSPATLHRDLDLTQQVLRDEANAETTSILIDDRRTAENARAYCLRAMPEMADRVEYFTGLGALFDRYDIEGDIAFLHHPRVALPSGGWITVEGTESLTAIDVNSGSYTASGGLEETALKINLEAAKEAGRQIRLRGIGGLIVVDFIHLSEPKNIQRVLDALAESLARDRVPFQLSAWSEFGIVQITRKRSREPLSNHASKPCQTCHGAGRQPTAESVALEILRRIQNEAAAAPGRLIVLRAAPDVTDWLNSYGEVLRERLLQRGAARVHFEADETFGIEQYDVNAQS